LETRFQATDSRALRQRSLSGTAGGIFHQRLRRSGGRFDKDVTKITLPEAAFLAGIIRSPNRYNPYRDIDTATAREVLVSMTDTGAISLESAQAQATPLKVASVKGRIDASDAPYFADYADAACGHRRRAGRSRSSTHIHDG
jgi:membrane peptidoglycan carboxypeptidase